jgi:excisionase family DNA binding protein
MENGTSEHSPTSGITRREAAERLRVDERTVRRWEQAGKLRAHRDADGGVRYAVSDIDQLAREHSGDAPCGVDEPERDLDPGELAAKVFALLNSGKDPREVVVELRLPPKQVQVLHAEWIAMGSAILLTHNDRCHLARSIGAPRTVAELITAVEKVKAQADLTRDLVWPCGGCDKPVPVSREVWRAVVESGVLNRWGHGTCEGGAEAG